MKIDLFDFHKWRPDIGPNYVTMRGKGGVIRSTGFEKFTSRKRFCPDSNLNEGVALSQSLQEIALFLKMKHYPRGILLPVTSRAFQEVQLGIRPA